MLEQLLRILLELFYGISSSYGWSLILMSASVTIIMLPLYYIAEKIQEKDIMKKNAMQDALEEIKDIPNQQEKYFYTREIYKQHSYHPINSMVGLLGLAIQIPFFIAAYRLIGHYEQLDGVSFGIIHNLFDEDKLINIGGLHINLLPFVMTAVNLFSSYIYILLSHASCVQKDMGTHSSQTALAKSQNQLVIIAILFLFLLYKQPAALVLYWTMNNVFGIVKNYLLIRLLQYRNPEMRSSMSISVIMSKIMKDIQHSTVTRSKRLFLAIFLYIPFLIFVLILFMYAQAQGMNAVSNVATKSAILVTSVIFSVVYIIFCYYHYATLKKKLPSFISSCVCVTVSSIIMLNLSRIVPEVYVGEMVLLLIGIQMMGAYLIFMPLLAHIYGFSLKEMLYAVCNISMQARKKKSDETRKRNIQSPIVGHKKIMLMERVTFICSTLTVFMITFINNPLLIFNTDAKFFGYPIQHLLFYHIFIGMAMVAILCVLYACRSMKKILLYISFSSMIIVWISAYIYTPYIGIMEGMNFRSIDDLFRNTLINIVEIIMTLALLGVAYTVLQKRKQLAVIISVLALILISIVTLKSYVSHDYTKNTRALTYTASTTPLPEDNHVRLSFSDDKENIVVIVFDGFVGPLVTKIFREYPNLKEKFEGFRYYTNTVSVASYTFGSMLAILKGKSYVPSNYNREFSDKYDNVKEAYKDAYMYLPDLLSQSGYISYLHNLDWIDELPQKNYLNTGFNDEYHSYWKQKFGVSGNTIDKRQASKFLLILSLFKNLPYWAKPIYYKFLKLDELSVSEQAYDYASNQVSLLELFPHIANNESEQGTYKFFHFLSTHGPYSIDKDLQLKLIYDKQYNHSSGVGHYYHLVYSLRAFSTWIDWMKEQGIYDNTKIILVSDHGFNEQSTTEHWWDDIQTDADKGFSINKGTLAPLLMMKDIGARGDIIYDNKPMINSDLPYLITSEIPDEAHVYQLINSIRTRFNYENVKQVSDYEMKKKFVISEQAEIQYNPQEDVMYYKMDGEDVMTPIFQYGDK